MSEVEGGKSIFGILGGISLFLGFAFMALSPGIGITCCLFGFFGLAASAISSSSASVNGAEGKMVLKQGTDGQWNWVANSAESNQQIDQAGATQYNDQTNQILSRVVTEVRNGTKLEDLEPDELKILASTYGINGGTKQQKVNALIDSELASKALKLSALGAASGLGVIGTAKMVKAGRERTIARAEEVREQAKDKLQENIDTTRSKINSKIPLNQNGETPEDMARNIVMQQLSSKIKEMDLTPEKLIELADLDNDGKIDMDEITVALSSIMGVSVPAFIVINSFKEIDKSGDGKIDSSELYLLWKNLGIEVVEDDDFEEIDSVMEEITIDQIVTEKVFEEVPEHTSVESEQVDEVDKLTENDASNIELTDGIDTVFEEFIAEMENAKFSSERRKLMASQVTEYLVNLRITKVERTLIGDKEYRGGQSVHALIDGGPYSGIVKIPISYNEQILEMRTGDQFKALVRLTDFSSSLKRPVLEASSLK
tara:strand:- start:2127 stop:3581 length:1455 start_codon:yes stop_codon:yes gene_type:complete